MKKNHWGGEASKAFTLRTKGGFTDHRGQDNVIRGGKIEIIKKENENDSHRGPAKNLLADWVGKTLAHAQEGRGLKKRKGKRGEDHRDPAKKS